MVLTGAVSFPGKQLSATTFPFLANHFNTNKEPPSTTFQPTRSHPSSTVPSFHVTFFFLRFRRRVRVSCVPDCAGSTSMEARPFTSVISQKGNSIDSWIRADLVRTVKRGML
ncbi:hypothetical protein Droror1_Dr00024318 [Drosera rotundifolia]